MSALPIRQRKRERWTDGNRLRLLENGEEFFPSVFAAIEAAEREVIIETFILFEDKVGLALQAVLIAAARRGVQVDVTVDGFGSPALSSGFVDALTAAGVRLHVFDPPPRLSRRLKPLRRLHRKIAAIDGRIGYIGGLNFSADHLGDFGPEAKQDYAVEVEGPAAAELQREARKLIDPERRHLRWWPERHADGEAELPRPATPPAGRARALLVKRDNHGHRDDIERYYRLALHGARREVIIANAYFFPGYRLLKSMQRAARRGVAVKLILQGQPDVALAQFAARMVYDRLLAAGVQIFEYCERPMHGKVALVDDEWATIGSSNLDPLSLALNLEANLVVHDRDFNAQLRDALRPLIEQRCKPVGAEHAAAARWWWRLGIGTLVFHLMRRFPRWAQQLPAHRPLITPAQDSTVVVAAPAVKATEPYRWQSAGDAPAVALGKSGCPR